jgi:translation initiation factor IF-1
VKETLPNGLVVVGFRNGHQVTAHLSGRDRADGRQLTVGESVTVEMSPFDFSHGRVKV